MPFSARPRPEAASAPARRWHRARFWGLLLAGLYLVASWIVGADASKQPPFGVLLSMARLGVFMEFHDRGLPLPRMANFAPDARPAPCFGDGVPDPDLRGDSACHPGLFPAEGSHAHTDLLRWWSKARVTGVIAPAFLLDSGFVSRRLIPYVEEPCRAVRDFDTVVLPQSRAQAEARQDGRPISDFVRRGIGDDIELLRIGFDCTGDGRPRREWQDLWAATTFRLHLYDARGEAISTIELVPGWAEPRVGRSPAHWRDNGALMRWLPAQFPPAARLDPPGTRAHSSP